MRRNDLVDVVTAMWAERPSVRSQIALSFILCLIIGMMSGDGSTLCQKQVRCLNAPDASHEPSRKCSASLLEQARAPRGWA